ncbi:hypothetical protein GCM10011317_37860 [Niveispirillum cyanobacteriorum]|nr:hypothetical protein GCM10011317_37860 [Niveispirillum cyanobacteriorum]
MAVSRTAGIRAPCATVVAGVMACTALAVSTPPLPTRIANASFSDKAAGAFGAAGFTGAVGPAVGAVAGAGTDMSKTMTGAARRCGSGVRAGTGAGVTAAGTGAGVGTGKAATGAGGGTGGAGRGAVSAIGCRAWFKPQKVRPPSARMQATPAAIPKLPPLWRAATTG